MADNVTSRGHLIHQQLHAYRGGHELLASTISLGTSDQDLIDRLSDLAGPIGPGDKFAPYLTLYPLPSGNFYVFARTWQDLSARRAGCVITRSLVIPMALWASSAGILAALISELEELHQVNDGVKDVFITPNPNACFSPVSGGMTAELVEALFLESRQPIVVLDTPDADSVTLRLMESFWPSLRRTFSACTHAYSPRGIEGRSFDLLFAPAGAWSNYGRWKGRQIDGRSSFRPRHRWTEILTQRIFQDPVPGHLLGAFGSLDLSADDADESALRLLLMWTELEQRSESSPQAVLGLLDIASTRKDPNLLKGLLPVVDRSLALAAAGYTPSVLLAYLQTLLGKFPTTLPPKSLLRKVRKHAEEASLKEPHVALDVLANATDDPIPAVIIAGIGDGLANSSQLAELTKTISNLGQDTVQLLLGFSKKFSSRFIQMVEAAEDSTLIQQLATILDTRDQARRSRLRRNILPHLHSAAWEETLRALLISSSPGSISNSVKALWLANKLENPRFGLALRDAADDPKKLAALRTSLLNLPPTQAVDRAILNTVALNESDVNWLSASSSDWIRNSKLVETLVERAHEWEIRTLPERSIEVLMGMLDAGLPETAKQIAALLQQSQPVLNRSIGVVNSLIPHLDENVANRLAAKGLESILNGRASCQPYDATAFFNNHANRVPPRDLVMMLAGLRTDADRTSKNLRLLGDAPDSIKSNVAPRVDELSDQLSRRFGLAPTKDAIDSWAEFIRFSGKFSEAAQLRAASTALQFALARKNLDVSALVVACFPIVYEELRQGRSSPSFLSYFSFVDWDRCRSAREELVEAFLESVWPPSQLIETAIYVDQLPEIVNILERKKSGREFLEHITTDPMILPEAYRSKLSRLMQFKS